MQASPLAVSALCRVLAAGAILPTAWGLAGCGATLQSTDGVVLEPNQPETLAAPSRLRTGSARFRDWDASKRTLLDLTNERTDGGWVRTRTRHTGDKAELIAVVSLGTNDSGEVVLFERVDHEERVEIVFDPPLIEFPELLEPGVPFEQNLRLTVHPLGDRSRTRAAGTAVSTVELLARETIRTGLGDIVAWRVLQTFTGSLTPASVQSRTEQWWRRTDDGLELVAERSEDATRVLGVPIRQASSAWVLDQITD